MLYRGESKAKHDMNEGKILPKNPGGACEVVATHNGAMNYDGRITYGRSEANRVAAHQVETGLYGGCSVSTTRSYEEAKRFALYADDLGVIYWLDDSAFDSHGVVAIEPSNAAIPSEQEVTIRAADGGAIPDTVITRVEVVERV